MCIEHGNKTRGKGLISEGVYVARRGSSAELGKLRQRGEKHRWQSGGDVIFGERTGCSTSVTDSLGFLCSIQSRHAAEND